MKMQMKKRISNQVNLVTGFWQNILLDGRVIVLARQFRKEIGMPMRGFSTDDEWNVWKEQMIKKNGSDNPRIDNFNEFEREVRKIHAHVGVLSDSGFRGLLIIYFYFNAILPEEFDELKFSEFDIVIVKDGEPIFSYKKEMVDGVYVKIGPKTSTTQLKSYLRSKGAFIKAAQNLYREMIKTPLAKAPKLHPNFERDNLIAAYSLASKKMLEERVGFGNTKEELIARLMREMGYNKGIMTSSVVKTVIQRRRKMIKASRTK